MGQTVGAMMHENAFGQFRVLRINRDENVIRDRKRSKTMPFYGYMKMGADILKALIHKKVKSRID